MLDDPADPQSPKDVALPDEVLEGLDESDKATVVATIMESFAGPIPPPKLLAAYNEIVENGAERLFGRFEKQGDHRMDMESAVVHAGIAAEKRGQYLATLVLLVFAGIAGYAAYLGQSAAAVLIAAADLLGGAGFYVYGKKQQQQELDKHK